LKLYETSALCPDRKLLHLGDHQEVEEAANTWFKNVQAANIPVMGPVLQEKAQEFARQMGVKDFEANLGWLFWFQEGQGISWRVVSDDEKSTDINAAKMWKEEKLLEIVCHTKLRMFVLPVRQPTSTNFCLTDHGI
jgi:hypothetical protein